jgi:hypothetical protein
MLACAHLVEVRSSPEGAEIRYAGEDLGPTPVQLRVRPFGPRQLEASLVGHRSLSTKLPLSLTTTGFVGDVLLLRPRQGLGLGPASVIELRLVREHAPVGAEQPPP